MLSCCRFPLVSALTSMLLALLLLCPCTARADKKRGPDKSVIADLEQLDKLLENRNDEMAIRLKRIDALRTKANGQPT